MVAREAALENLYYQFSLAQFAPEKHLREREEQYVDVFMAGDVMIVRETEQGWWKEKIQYKNETQLEKLKADPTVAMGWLKTRRFNDNGGWEQD